MKKISARLSKLEKELSQHKNKIKVSVSWNRKARAKQISQVEQKLGRAIPQGILDLYNQVNGFYWDWEIKQNKESNRSIKGATTIPMINYLFERKSVNFYKDGRGQLSFYWPDKVSEEEEREFEKYYVFDNPGFGYYILFKLESAPEDLKLFLFSHPNKIYPLGIGLKDYLTLLFKSRGMYFWQQYLFREEGFPFSLEFPDDFHQNMQKLFPQESLDDFEPDLLKQSDSIYNKTKADQFRFNYFEAFQERIAALQSDNRFEDLVFEFNPGVHQSVLRRIKNAYGFELSGEMLEFYFSLNGFRLSWTFRDNSSGKNIKGRIFISPLEKVFGGPGGMLAKNWDDEVFAGILWNKEDVDAYPEKYAPLKKARPIETFEGISAEIVVQVVDGGLDPEVYLLEKSNLTPLNMGFKDYVGAQLTFLGIEDWQQAVAYLLPETLEKIKTVFPEAELNIFKTK